MPRAFDWNGRNARYRDPLSGRFIPRATVRDWLDRDIRASQAQIQRYSELMRSGEITLGAWAAGMRQEIKRTQLASEILLRGGRSQTTSADFGRVGARVREQYKYLSGFVDDLRSGKQRTDGSFLSRARMYAGAARTGFHQGQVEQLSALGYRFEQNILAHAEHCAGCVAQAERGKVAIGSLVPIGMRDCLSNDLCHVAFS